MNEMPMQFRRQAPEGSELPLLITPNRPGEGLLDAFGRLRPRIEEALPAVGGVLLRGFDVPAVETFQQFAAAFGDPLLKYEFASTPRSAVEASTGAGVYTSTEYPAHQTIPLHNEQAYTREWPMRIWFHCVTAAPEGGETPIADSRAIYRRMPERIRRLFEPGVLYVRNFGEMDVPWQKVFNTDRRDAVEAFCAKAGIAWEWKDDGGLRTRQLCQGIEVHPRHGRDRVVQPGPPVPHLRARRGRARGAGGGAGHRQRAAQHLLRRWIAHARCADGRGARGAGRRNRVLSLGAGATW